MSIQGFVKLATGGVAFLAGSIAILQFSEDRFFGKTDRTETVQTAPNKPDVPALDPAEVPEPENDILAVLLGGTGSCGGRVVLVDNAEITRTAEETTHGFASVFQSVTIRIKNDDALPEIVTVSGSGKGPRAYGDSMTSLAASLVKVLNEKGIQC